jgi:hypothetical protein
MCKTIFAGRYLVRRWIYEIRGALFILIFTGWWDGSSGQVVIALLFGDKLNTDKLEFGLTVTPSLTNITNNDSKLKTGLNLGIYFNFRPDKRFYLRVEGIAKGSFGAGSIKPYPTGNDSLDALFRSGSVERKITGFGLPVLCHYRIGGNFFAEAGIQADWFLKAKDIFQSDVGGQQLEYTLTTSDEYTKLDLAADVGVFYKPRKDRKSVGIGLRYVHGLTDIAKTAAGTQANYMWQLNITIPVGAGKGATTAP